MDELQQAPKTKSSLFILLIIVTCLSSLTSGFLFWQNTKLRQQISQLTAQPSLTPIPLVSPASPSLGGPQPSVEAETTNWKTYTAAGVSFKFPPDWVEGPIQIFGSRSEVEFKYQNTPLFVLTIMGNYSQLSGKPYNTLDEFIGPRIDKAGDIIVNGLPAKIVTGSGDDGHVIPYQEVLTFTTDKLSIISLYYQNSYDTAPNQNSDVLDQILSTFKFIDNTQTSLIPADSQTPAAGICAQVQGPSALITLNIDTPSPRCTEVSANQKLTLTNGTNQTISLKYNRYESQILPGSSYTFPQTVDSFLAPGVHIITTSLYGGGGPEVWLQ